MKLQTQRGFTLVELAIVLVIVGLLISGVLKGQELISNAQVNATATKVKTIDAAMTTFKDNYFYPPGDLVTPTTTLAGCAAGTTCGAAGNGDGRIGAATGPYNAAAVAVASENMRAWNQLAAANLIGEVRVDSTGVAQQFGNTNPSAPVGGGFRVGYFTGGAAAGVINPAVTAGHHLVMSNLPTAATSATTVAVSAVQAQRLDRKTDDGQPNTGSVLAMGSAGGAATNCASTNTAAGVYNIAVAGGGGVACSLDFKLQN
jgi:prepilin-type N-terminal cleavage/methylation domain-containing protein